MSGETPHRKKRNKLLRRLISIPVIIVAALLSLYLMWDNMPSLRSGYQDKITTGGDLEAKYLRTGKYAVEKVVEAAEKPMGKYTVYYPSQLKTEPESYPLLVVVNGTGGKATKYEPLLQHYASWGFIVVGNQDKNTGHGISTIATLQHMLDANADPHSPFFGKIDVGNIGLTGFSQGGAATFNALTKFDEARHFKAAAPLSPVNEAGAATMTDYPYDISKVKTPVFMLAGTEGDFEVKTVIPFTEMQKMYDRLAVPKVMARRTGMTHDDMMFSASGYVTAWFRWQLMGDTEAAQAFTGPSPELITNTRYQDGQIDLEG